MKKFIICKTNFRKLSAKKMADRLALFFSPTNGGQVQSCIAIHRLTDGRRQVKAR